MIGAEVKARLAGDPDLLLVLPQEHQELKIRFQELEARNQAAADNMGEAVEDGNVWHDNSAYDAALAEMEQVDNVSKVLGPMIAGAEVVDPPCMVEVGATLGSNVLVDNGRAQFHVFLVGQNTFDLEHISLTGTDLEDSEIVSLRSPLGMAVLGSVVDQVVSYELPGGEEVSMTIIDVDQTKRLPIATQEAKE